MEDGTTKQQLSFSSKLTYRPSEFNSNTLFANINFWKIEWAEMRAIEFETARI